MQTAFPGADEFLEEHGSQNRSMKIHRGLWPMWQMGMFDR